MSKMKGEEKLLTLTFAFLFFGTFIVVAFINSPHGDYGNSYAPEEVDSSLIMDQGHIEDPAVPEDLLILGAGQESVLKFEVFNIDPDNDIDTIEVNIPGSTMTRGSTEWYKPISVHEWPYEIIGTDTMRFEAQDDFTGSEGGDDGYYDTAGSVDDALDYIVNFNDGDNPVYDLSEGITLSVSFNATPEPGFKMGDEAIDLKVGDLKSEEPGVSLTTFDPFPYPYIAAEDEDTYLIIILNTPSCHLEVKYGEKYLFSYSRGSDFRTSEFGFEYVTDSGSTIAVLEDPADTIVTPLIRSKETGSSGMFDMDIYKIKITDIESGSVEKIPIVSNYMDDIPSEIGTVVNNDLDNDGSLNLLDDDMDGDGIPNQEDGFPKIYNRMPVITGITENLTVREDQMFSLMVEANDPDSEDLTYHWTNDQDPGWSADEWKIDITGFEPGDYIFTVLITDELGNTRTETISVKIEENLPPVIASISPDNEEITVGDELTITVNASDPEGGSLTYTWTHNNDPVWEDIGNPIKVSDLEEGEYTFTVTVTDGWSNTNGSVQVTVKEKEEDFPWLFIIIPVVIILIIIVVGIFFVLLRKKQASPDETSTPQEQYASGYQEELPPESYYENFYQPEDSTPDAGTQQDAYIGYYPDEEPSTVEIGSFEDASIMEYPETGSQEQIIESQQEDQPIDEVPLSEPISSTPVQDSQSEEVKVPDIQEDQPIKSNTLSMPPPPPPLPVIPVKTDDDQ